ncbi:hypothetical protein LMG26857_05256 [Achromobacter anxifer]|uniref:DUF3426 domain-containing protein n=1 Tax=Achromobacter anxifer TaxID=1287737 RepID=UPI00155BC771|nr:DUF3426 domain-containing protein [Achromobacter anxifer]CAB5516186.1 hypothetical protein LMG26857_05256 [Achromobacter anxifer]
MALTTRCPQCGTTFKVVPDQLRVRNGLVRCGACSTVFDGRACLLPVAGAAPQPAVSAAPVMPEMPAAGQAAPVLATPAVPAVAAASVTPPAPVAPQVPVAPHVSLASQVPVAPQVPPVPQVPATPQVPVTSHVPAAPAVPAVPQAPATPAVPAYRPAAAAPAADPFVIPPWDDEPEPSRPAMAPATPASSAPAIPPAVLRGRDDIRRRAEPESGVQEHEHDEADEPADDDIADDDDQPRWTLPPVAQTGHRADPAPRGAQAEPAFTIGRARADVRDEERDDEYDNEYADEHRDDYDPDRDAPDRDQPGEPVLGDTRTRYSSATDVGRAPPEFLDQDRQERNGLLRKLWGYACLVGLIALGLQLVYAYRTDIANSVPVLRPVLETACQQLGCTVGYARRLDRIHILSSSLQPPTGAAAIDDGRSRLVLTVNLRNSYDKPQHWPALVLDLNDLSDTAVVRRVLRPEDYLTPEQLRGPFAPNSDLKISVPIEVTGVQVNGYQLDKFFP